MPKYFSFGNRQGVPIHVRYRPGWILEAAYWEDQGYWDDDAQWID